MIKLLIFDFDGVLADLKDIHFKALSKALSEHSISPPSYEEHISIYDGLSTKEKLRKMDISFELIESIFNRKQVLTMQMMEERLKHDERLVNLFSLLDQKYRIVVASNAIRTTIKVGLVLLGIDQYVECIYSNQSVKNQKPHPEIFLKAMSEWGATPDETIIFEDSKHGREAAMRSGAYVFGVDSPADLVYKDIKQAISSVQERKIQWAGTGLTVLIPMAGAGSRFKEAGYKLPKPLIDVNGKPMIQRVVENLNIYTKYIFIVQKEHYEQHNLGILLPLIVPMCEVVQTDGLTEGAACTTLLAKEHINNDNHLLIANSDQLVDWDSCDFLYSMISHDVDGGILTFKDTDPKWSFAKVENGFVTEVAEKNPISDMATCGVYYFKRGREYVKYAEQRIAKNIRHNNEYYIAPTYNEMIEDGKKIIVKECAKMFGLGTPEDLQGYLNEIR